MAPYSKNWGAMQRVFYYANFLTKNNFRVTVFASKNTRNLYEIKNSSDFNIVHFDNSIQNLVPIDHSRKKYPENRTRVLLIFIKKYLKQLIKLLESSIYNEPSIGAGINSHLWIKKHQDNIITHIEKHNYDNLILSVPPFGILQPRFINKVKKSINGYLVIDYRDPWNCWNKSKGLAFLREKKILKLSDKIITTNNNHLEKLISDFKLPSNKISVIMNGYDEVLWQEIENNNNYVDKSDKLIISYVGTISFKRNHFRNCTTFLEAFMNFTHKDKLLLRFVGVELSDDERDNLERKYPGVEFISKVTQAESFNLMLQSHILMNIHTANDESSKYLIGGKLFDYYRSKKIILSVNSHYSYEFKFISENNLGYCVENNLIDINNVLNEIYIDWNTNNNLFAVNKEFVIDKRFSRYEQNKKLLSIL